VWGGSLIMGMIFGFCVSYSLLRFYGKIPARSPILKSVILSFLFLVIALILVDVPMMLYASGDALNYFFIGVAFNVVRFLFLGIAVGHLYNKRYG